jgi:oxazoline/thiazoline synthase
LRRALTELNQMMPAVVAESGSDSWRSCPDADLLDWWRHATTANQPYLSPYRAERPRTPRDYDYTPRRDLSEDVTAVQGKLEALGMEVLVLDQTRPDIELPVVKVLVPGLRHFWARFGPGRLYDVPVHLGRQTASTPYDELNPIPMFL